jgi:hypothetical protein
MTSKEAEETLSVIRTLMERSTRYTNVSGHAGITAGLCALIGSALRLWLDTPFLTTWLGVLIAATGTSVYFTAAMAHGNGEPLWTRQTRTVVLALTPAFACTLIMTAVLARLGEHAILPGVWMLLWGVGALAMSFFTARVITLLGVSFMVAGTLALFSPPVSDAVSMGLTFGAIHLAYGIILTVIRRPASIGWPVFRHLC